MKNSRLLFVLPVYALDEQTFNAKWEKYLSTLGKRYSQVMKNVERERMIWKYNRIIAFIEIQQQGNDIYFIIYRNTCGSFRFDYLPHGAFIESPQVGNHFRVSKNDSDATIKEKIDLYLNYLMQAEFKHRFIDRTAFDSQIELFHISELFL